jgi:hypothetical protein
MTEKERLHSLVEELPEPEVHAALRFVEYLRREAADAVARALREAPCDDEPLTADDLAELDAAELDRQEGASCLTTPRRTIGSSSTSSRPVRRFSSTRASARTCCASWRKSPRRRGLRGAPSGALSAGSGHRPAETEPKLVPRGG